MNNHLAISGSLKFMNLGDVIQILGTNNSTGKLCVKGKYEQEPGFVYVQKGNPIHAAKGSLKGLDAFYSLFGVTEGTFEFVQEPVDQAQTIKKSRMELILDGLQMLDEGQIEQQGAVQFEKKNDRGESLALIRGPLVDYMYVVEEENFSDGMPIVLEGNLGNWFYVILEGAVRIEKETPTGPMPLLKIGTGSFVGSLASFLIGDNVRSATAIAHGDVVLGMLDSQRLYGEFVQMSPAFKEMVRGMDRRLKQVTQRAIEARDRPLNVADFTKGKKKRIDQGQDMKEVFQITAGHAAVVRIRDKVELPLCVLEAGDFFGHLPFFDIGMEPYAASVYVSDDFETAPVDSAALQEEFEKLSQTFKNIIENVATAVSVTTMRVHDLQRKKRSDRK